MMNKYTISAQNYSNLFTNENIVNSAVNNRIEFIKIIRTLDMCTEEKINKVIELVQNCTSEDFTAYCNAMNQHLKICSPKDAIIASQILSILIRNKEDIEKEQCYLILNALQNIDNQLYLVYQNDTSADKSQCTGAISVLHKAAADVMQVGNYFRYGYMFDIEDTFKSKIELNNFVVTESAFIARDPEMDTSYITHDSMDNGIEKLAEYLRNKTYEMNVSDDSEFIIAKFKDIPKYVYMVYTSSSRSEEYLSLPYYMIAQCHNIIRNNIRGLDILYDMLDEIYNNLDSLVYSTFEAKEAAEKLRILIENIKDNISKEEYLIRSGEIEEDTNLIIECGLGFIYDYLPLYSDEKTTEHGSEMLEEAFMTNEAIAGMQMFMGILDEAFNEDDSLNEGYARDTLNIQKKKIFDQRARRISKYNRKNDMKNTLAERKIANKEELKQHKLDEKNQNKIDRFDEKMQRKNDKREHRQEMRDIKAELRKIPGANAGTYGKMVKLLGLVSAGSLLFNRPMTALVFGFFSKLLRGKSTNAQLRANAMNVINQQIQVIDNHLQTTTNQRTRNELMVRKQKLNQLLANTAFGVTNAGGGGVVAVPTNAGDGGVF